MSTRHLDLWKKTCLEEDRAEIDHVAPAGVLTEGDEPRFGRDEENAVKG